MSPSKLSVVVFTVVLVLTALYPPSAEAAKKQLRVGVGAAVSGALAKRVLKNTAHKQAHKYVQPPRGAPEGFPNLEKAKRKTPVQGGGNLRERWKDEKGAIYEWDSRHGTIEKFDRNGRHLGEFDPMSGAQLKGPNSAYRIDP